MLVKIIKDKNTPAMRNCTSSWEKDALVFSADNINVIHDNDHYTCFSHIEKKIV